MLPSDSKLTSQQDSGATQIEAEIDAQYKGYRRFSADARFVPADPGR